VIMKKSIRHIDRNINVESHKKYNTTWKDNSKIIHLLSNSSNIKVIKNSVSNISNVAC